jgi:hypothetical protein
VNPDRAFAAGYAALQPYLANDDLWSPSDELERLLDDPTTRQRVGEIIAHAIEHAPPKREH